MEDKKPMDTQMPEEGAQQQDSITLMLQNLAKKWPQFTGIMVAVMLVALVIGYVRDMQQEAELSAWSAAAEARSNPDAEQLGKRLEDVVAKHPGTKAAFHCKLEIMQIHFDEGRTAEAMTVAKAILKEYRSNPYAQQVRADYARLLETEGKWVEALRQYEMVLAQKNSYVKGEALLGKARCLQQDNRPEEARAIYKDLVRQRREMSARIVKAAELGLMTMSKPGRAIVKAAEPKKADALKK
jgi:tetratricopeptide (TPR) repeat protein